MILCVIFYFSSCTFALVADNTLKKTDILEVGMDMYSLAQDWEVSSISGYNEEAFKNFSDKVNTLIQDNETLQASFQELCGDCDPVILSTLDDDERLLNYLKNKAESGAPSLSLILASHMDKRFENKAVPIKLISTLGNLVEEEIIVGIRSQVIEQVWYFRDVAGMGLYYDGDVENSPYDLLADIQSIDEIFFRDPPEYGPYKNSSSDEASQLITGEDGTGSWWSSSDYSSQLDASAKKSATRDASVAWEKPADESTDECENGYCVTVQKVESSDPVLWTSKEDTWTSSNESSDKGKNSFQGLFEDWVAWLIKEGDNLNLACQVSPTIQFFENKFSRSARMADLFSGASIFPSLTPPPILVNFFQRKKTKDEQEQSEKRVLDSIKRSFLRYDLDSARPTNINATQSQSITTRAVTDTTKPVSIQDSLGAFLFSKEDYAQMRRAAGSLQQERPFVKALNVESMKHMEVTFDDTAGRMRMLLELVKTLEIIVDFISEKGDCPGS